MSTLVKFQVSDRLSDELAGIIKHQRSSKPYKDFHAVDSTKLIIECLQYAYKLKNFGIPSNESLNFDAKEISKLIHQKYKFYTEYDIKLCFKLGAVGEFKKENEINNLSVEVVNNWFKRYDDEKRKVAIAEQRRFEDALEKIRSEEESKKGKLFFLQTIINLYNDWELLKKEPKKNLSLYFDKIREMGLCDITKEEYHDLNLTGEALYKQMELQENIFVNCNKDDVKKELALNLQFKKWLQQGKQLIIENEQLKLV